MKEIQDKQSSGNHAKNFQMKIAGKTLLYNKLNTSTGWIGVNLL